MKPWFLLTFLVALTACAPSGPASGVWRPGADAPPTTPIPGPLPGFGPFHSFSEALQAACPFILSKPNAVAGHLRDRDPRLAFRASTEYCAWLYYTPDHLYEMSMLTDQSAPDDLVSGKRSCILPAVVADARYAPGELKYIFALHNHPFGGPPSPGDLRFTDEMARMHAWAIETRDSKVLLSIIAFFSMSGDAENPTCDGFYQYVPATRDMLKWARADKGWTRETLGTVTWINTTTYRLDKKPRR
ncbi:MULTISPECIES: hypothetical protein [Corallococcus]|uniref:hypothetical protein n=1 Tax=Corallococcus TaxID=83461 RepID=UPI001D04B949|nr:MULTISPECIES: hypothetical protein [Corallococcus]MCY1032905.1 hypothetical protein [Corallococcus sp. BB11-1]